MRVDRVPVFLCGEPARGDDAAAFLAADLLPPEAAARARIERAGQLDALLLMDLPTDAPCVVVDAVAGVGAGVLWVRPLGDLVALGRERAADGGRTEPRSSHELPVEQVLALAAVLRSAPPRGWFVGIGGLRFGHGDPLSPEVAAALPAAAAAIADAIADLAPAP